MTRTITLGISPCPNDTFIFHGLIHGLVGGLVVPDSPDGPETLRVDTVLEDVETLNTMAERGELDAVKISTANYPAVAEEYVMLRSGGALGRGCGPLLVARPRTGRRFIRSGRMAVPGRRTTAHLLLEISGLHDRIRGRRLFMPYHQVMAMVVSGGADAGVVIHESRFTYREMGLELVEDLGAFWERETGLPIPLGCIVCRRGLGAEVALALEDAIRRSLALAREHREQPWPWVRENARELSDEIIESHIAMFVTDFSLNLGPEGERAVRRLLEASARLEGLALPEEIFAGDAPDEPEADVT